MDQVDRDLDEPPPLPPWDDPEKKIEYSIIGARKDIQRLEGAHQSVVESLAKELRNIKYWLQVIAGLGIVAIIFYWFNR